jgi:hypothetical protein
MVSILGRRERGGTGDSVLAEGAPSKPPIGLWCSLSSEGRVISPSSCSLRTQPQAAEIATQRDLFVSNVSAHADEARSCGGEIDADPPGRAGRRRTAAFPISFVLSVDGANVCLISTCAVSSITSGSRSPCSRTTPSIKREMTRESCTRE